MASSTMIRSVQMQNIEPLPAEVIKAFAEGLNEMKALLGGWPILCFPSIASGLKCDLEAVCVKPRGGSDFGRLSKFVKSAIVNENWLA